MVGSLIRQRRRVLGWSQEVLAEKMGWQQTYLSRVERGEIEVPQRATLERLGELLGVSLQEFYAAAGMLEGVEIGMTAVPVPPTEGDRPFDPALIVRFVESKPDEVFQAALAQEKQRRKDKPGSYERLCLRIYRAWTSNADLVMGELEQVGRE